MTSSKQKEVDCGFELSSINVPTDVLHEEGECFRVWASWLEQKAAN